ncbi:hypothetical protein NPS01_02580 [Nocardioides psychrotolerans]|uniref:4'-phosphopantetheinyl transferase n=1 Tax=Nocardioides psychrotolerans TaxID=1005945 RepID=A0A1I3BLG6_9ACTN|nr:hypothetical protein [Nocardioides psychrotolerans]GEP36595.1 hypothetical protein NPS01_02580 [Nocardioides psychrotolerans]SFH62611.1 hypothetical protein SAMN05216561_101181 [Nocardioides psychrotolerans]
MTPTVHVAALWGSGHRAFQRARAEAYLADELCLSRVARLCVRCASPGHGRPVPLGASDAVHLSLAYAEDVVLVAWSSAPVGVDVERDAPGRGAGDYGDLRVWTRIEAIVKTSGEGLSREPVDLPELWTSPLPLPEGWVGTVACAVPAELSWRSGHPAHRGGPAAPPR